jgi:D-glycero-alpha-D-manno-heptose 1-phosphate guanylyltransferase
METEAIVLAGGMGTRLKSVISNIPKPMAIVAQKPFLTYILDQLCNTRIANVKLSVGYKHEVIQDYFGSNYKHLNLEYIFESEPLGTGGGIRLAAESCKSKSLLICNGDTYFDVELEKFINAHNENQNGMSIALKFMEKVNRYGMVDLDGSKLLRFNEKSEDLKSGWINGGIYVLDRELFLSNTKPGRFSMETDFMEKMVDDIKIEGFKSEGYFVDIGIPEDYLKANNYFEQ